MCTLRAIKLCEDPESSHFENKKLLRNFLKCTEFRIEDFALGLEIMRTGRKRRVRTCTEM